MLTSFRNKQQEEESGGDERKKRKVTKHDTIEDNKYDEELDDNGITDTATKATNDVTNEDDDNEDNQGMTVIHRSE